jgi:hypothetical protein
MKDILHETKIEYDESYLRKEPEPITVPRIGRIVRVENGEVLVDFDGNPEGRPLPARLSRPFMMSDIETAVENVLDVRLEFIDGRPDRPVVADIYYSILDSGKKTAPKDIHVVARKIVLEGTEEVVIKSGNAQTTYSALGGRLVEEATQIKSSAVVTNKIQGGSINLN